MLDSLRGAAQSWVAKLLLGLLSVSFVAWGVGDVFRQGFTGNSVLSAGSSKVSPIEYRLAYNRQLALYQQQLNQRLTREQAKDIGIDGQVMAQLVAGVVLDEQSRKMKLGLSTERLATLTAEDPAFKDASGSFSRAAFDGVLRNAGMRPEDYLKSRGQVAIRQQVVESMTDGIKAPDAYLSALALHGGESRDVDYIALSVSIVQPVAEPADGELQTFYDARKANYKAPEYRKFSYVALTPESIANTAAVDDAAVKADYDKNIARYTKLETRKIDQLVFASKDAALAAKAKLASGAGFDDIVKAENKTPADVAMGDLQKKDLPDAKIADAAFQLAAGAVSDVIDGAFGPVLIRIAAVTAASVQPYDSVKEQIRKDIALNEANAVLLESHDAYEDGRGGGDTMAAAAQKAKLKMVTVDAVDAGGLKPDGSKIEALPGSAELLSAVFAAEPALENAPLNLQSNGFLWYEVIAVTAERERPVAEIKAKLTADWKSAKGAELLAVKAAEIAKQAKDGKSLDELAAGLKLEKATKRGLQRDVDDADFDAATVEAAFGGGKDYVTVSAGGSGETQFVLKVAETYEPADKSPGAIADDQKKRANSAVSDDLLDQLVARLQGEFPVTVNQALIERALAN
jgi:peptidyl-prolyl cis-trans isomerase D